MHVNYDDMFIVAALKSSTPRNGEGNEEWSRSRADRGIGPD